MITRFFILRLQRYMLIRDMFGYVCRRTHRVRKRTPILLRRRNNVWRCLLRVDGSWSRPSSNPLLCFGGLSFRLGVDIVLDLRLPVFLAHSTRSLSCHGLSRRCVEWLDGDSRTLYSSSRGSYLCRRSLPLSLFFHDLLLGSRSWIGGRHASLSLVSKC